MSVYRALPFRGFPSSLTIEDDVLTTERITGRREGHTIECIGTHPWSYDLWLNMPSFMPTGAQVMQLSDNRIGVYHSYMHRHEHTNGRFFFDVFSLRGAHITALGEVDLHQLALGADTLWIIRRVQDGDASGLSIEGHNIYNGIRIGPKTMTDQLIQKLGEPISKRLWSEIYSSSSSLWGLNWQGGSPWLTIQVLRLGKRSVRKRYHLPLELALTHLETIL